MFIRQGEYMDNLLFVYHLIVHENIENLKKDLPQLAHKIQETSNKIYHKYYSVATLTGAWLLRKYCPVMMFSSSASDEKTHFLDEEWCDIQKEVPMNENDERVAILKKYHSKEYRDEYDKIIEIKVIDIVDIASIEALQIEVLKFLHKKEIVIETLPTSNVRIGHHHDFDSYHLWRWTEWEKEGKSIPPIVVGTDDAGIFATNIFNEYANIYSHLTCQSQMTHNEAMALIERLDKNGRIYKFGS
jgi:hypothetical protein